MLKLFPCFHDLHYTRQPPSGGCVLKLGSYQVYAEQNSPATFGWLCVETMHLSSGLCFASPATFGWLCVETLRFSGVGVLLVCPATFGWLCVETEKEVLPLVIVPASHLRVAVC